MKVGIMFSVSLGQSVNLLKFKAVSSYPVLVGVFLIFVKQAWGSNKVKSHLKNVPVNFQIVSNCFFFMFKNYNFNQNQVMKNLR